MTKQIRIRMYGIKSKFDDLVMLYPYPHNPHNVVHGFLRKASFFPHKSNGDALFNNFHSTTSPFGLSTEFEIRQTLNVWI